MTGVKRVERALSVHNQLRQFRHALQVLTDSLDRLEQDAYHEYQAAKADLVVENVKAPARGPYAVERT